MIAFGGCLWAPFHLDDRSLAGNPAVQNPSGWLSVFDPLQTRPLTVFSFWLNQRFGGAPFGYHLVNLLLHLASVLVAHRILLRLLEPRAALIGALIFAIHPLQTEAVVYIFARGTLLATLLCLVGLLRWLQEHRWETVAWFAAALLAKEEVAAFPLFLILLAWSLNWLHSEWKPVFAMLALSLAAGVRVIWASTKIAGAGLGAAAGIGWFDYFSQQGLAILRYLWLLLMPLGLTPDPDIRVESPLLAALAWAVIGLLVILAQRRVPRVREGFWLVGGLLLLLPSSSIFPAADLAADRRMYLPLFAFGAMFGVVLEKLKTAPLVAAGVLLLGASHIQTRLWQSEEELWMEAARLAPNKVRPKRQLARLVSPQQALTLLIDAKELAPDDAGVAGDLGKAYLDNGQMSQALVEFGRALALAPGDPIAIHNRGVALAALGQKEAAAQDFERALDKDPCLFDAYLNLAKIGAPKAPPVGCRWTAAQQTQFNAATSAR